MKKQTITTSTYNYTYPQPFNPEVHIAVKNNRMKSYDHNGEKCIYLDDGTEFQLEFYNDSNCHAKAVIEINGVQQGSALVLRPYQRFYLDRFMDDQKKLKFNTFLTGNDDIEKLKEIIAKNGRIKITFYKEFFPLPTLTWTTFTTEQNNPLYDTYYTSNSSPTANINYNQQNLTNKGQSSFDSRCMLNEFSAQMDMGESRSSVKSLNVKKEIETGRVEAGSKSDQDFSVATQQFEIFYSSIIEYHIMPVSQKPKIQKIKKAKDVIVADDIRTYCPGCGRRVKKGWQFCAGCGYKF